MKCPSCYSEIKDDSRFCSNCGTPIVLSEKVAASLVKTLQTPAQEMIPGKVLAGKYKILEEIGRGGMGIVYKAEDTKLARKVAIKVLPEVFTQDPERLARFEREARVLASLNHPNIAAIHGVEEADGKRLLVLELVEGETLAERLSQGALSLEEILEVCSQIAEGLEGAHEKAIIHRDLKPSNVKITPERKVKILDFGLAKAFHDQISEIDISKSPTITADMTQPGVILGTAAYMSPEQATGRPADKRADIWAFGCILFECLTGKRAFLGDTVTESIAAIIRGEPAWDSLPAGTPENVRAVLRRCLQKDPRERLHDIADARIEMQEETGMPAATVSAPALGRLRPVVLVAACAAALIVGILIGPVVRRFFKPTALPTSVPLVRSWVRLGPGCWLGSRKMFEIFNPPRPTRTEMAVSTDGRFLVYSAVKADPGPSDRSRLYLRRFDQLEAKPIAGTEGGLCPFLSPGGNWVGFWADGKLMKIPSEGGIPTALCDVLRPFGFSWGPGNEIVFVRDRDSGLMRISADGGKPETLTVPDRSKEEFAHRLPHFLPDGNRILFTIKRNPWDLHPNVAVLELASRKWRVLLEDGADGRYVATGHLAFLRQGTLMVVPFDPDRLEVTGQPVPALANVSQTLNTTTSYDDTAAGQFDVSASGSLIYATGGIAPNQENALVWADHKGQVEPVVSFKAPFYSTRLSPDGRRIAYSLLGMEGHIWIHDLARGTATRMMSEGMAQWALWTPDGERLVFDWLKTGVPNIYWQPADGSSPTERLTESEYFQWPGSLSPDGETLAFVEQHEETGSDIYFLNIRDRRATPFLNSRFFEAYPEISPNGRWIAYVTDESGREEVYVQAFPGHRGKWQISHEGGSEPLWAPNGRQLFYWSAGLNQVWVVDVEAESGFSAGKPRLLFNLAGYGGGSPIRIWDISRDGRRFLMAMVGESKSQPITEIILVQNWFEELKRLVPTGRK